MFHYFRCIARYPASIRLGIFLIFLLGIWLPIAVPIYRFWGTDNFPSLIAGLILYSEFIWLLWLWGRIIYQRSHPFQWHGLVWTRCNGLEMLRGLFIGFIILFCLYIVEAWLGWIGWQTTQFSYKIILEGLIVALGVGFAEELLFRGWLVDELRLDYSFQAAFWGSGSIYALLHFVKPWSEVLRTLPGFPGLLLLSLTLSWARQLHDGRLGFAIGFHTGLVWGYYVINVGNLVRYLDRVPVWLTGIDRNPLAGGVGLLLLTSIGLSLKKLSRSRKNRPVRRRGHE